VRVCSAQALARFGSPAEVVVVFRIAVGENLLTRILLAEPLRPHALELSTAAVPDELRSGDVARILATLQIVVAWERALPLTGLDELMLHPEREIRLQALRVAPLVTASRENELAVVQALADPDPEVAMAAAALAALPPQGWQILEELAAGGDPTTVSLAADVLRRLRPAGSK
jgi:hypothetical protein